MPPVGALLPEQASPPLEPPELEPEEPELALPELEPEEPELALPELELDELELEPLEELELDELELEPFPELDPELEDEAPEPPELAPEPEGPAPELEPAPEPEAAPEPELLEPALWPELDASSPSFPGNPLLLPEPDEHDAIRATTAGKTRREQALMANLHGRQLDGAVHRRSGARLRRPSVR